MLICWGNLPSIYPGSDPGPYSSLSEDEESDWLCPQEDLSAQESIR